MLLSVFVMAIISAMPYNHAYAQETELKEIPNDPYTQGCIDCPGGVKFFCAWVGFEGCFDWPCGGGYC